MAAAVDLEQPHAAREITISDARRQSESARPESDAAQVTQRRHRPGHDPLHGSRTDRPVARSMRGAICSRSAPSLFEMLTGRRGVRRGHGGRRPCGRSRARSAAGVLVFSRMVPSAVDDMVRRCLAKDARRAISDRGRRDARTRSMPATRLPGPARSRHHRLMVPVSYGDGWPASSSQRSPDSSDGALSDSRDG